MKTYRYTFATALLLIALLGQFASAGLVESRTLNAGCAISSTELPVVIDDAVSMIRFQARPYDLFVDTTPVAGPLNANALGRISQGFSLVSAYVAPVTAKSGSSSVADALSQGDINQDGTVSEPDLDVLKSFWGVAVTPFTEADASGDGYVGGADLDVVRKNWGKTVGSGFVPEPSAAVTLLLMAAMGLLRRGR